VQLLDTGHGIPADKTEAIFREVNRLREGRQGGERGLGLGLAIVDRIARMLDHPVSLQSEPGQGTRFAIPVPMAQSTEAASAGRTSRPRSAQDLSSMLFVVIDNDKDILAGMASLVAPWGCEVHTARDELEVRQVIDSLKAMPDVLLADYHLDDQQNGIDLMNRIRARYNRPIPGILITADQTETVRNDAAAQAYRVLHKPLKPAALRALLGRLAGRRR
ncbi:MAG: response regulator, partial [Wenzhouxiangella sp.]|nr:response regulator [Wenzhouxiangella sp.]